ncbi:MAG: excinuclease ABC subunit UvrC [Candidatus Nanopelagicales bacterium]
MAYASGGLSYRPEPGSIPDAPGVYRFRDEAGVVIYVGKARSLRSRLNSYFADMSTLHPRTCAMVNSAGAVDWVTVANEVEALQLEYSWIKQYDPRFNVRYRDDKSYPYLAVTVGEQFPRIQVMRGDKKKGVRYFGPYAHAWAIRETVDQLLRVFPMRSCSKGVFNRHQRIGRPCLLGDIGKCAAPCVGRVSEEEHREIVDDLCRFLGGRTDAYVSDIEQKMRQAATELDFERAARLRDDLGALRRALARSAVVLPDGTDADVIALFEDDLQAAVQVFHVRGGRVTGQRGLILERMVDEDAPTLMEQYLMQLYGEQEADRSRALIPREVVLSHPLPDQKSVVELLSELRGSRVRVGTPARGPKRELLATVEKNASQDLALHKVRRAGDLTARGVALEELQAALDLPQAPLRIECIDISSHQGTDITASIVVFEDALPKKSHYRKFAMDDHLDDVTAMYQAVSRRFARLSPDAAGDDRTRYRPGLLVVDGGAPQVNAAAAALRDLNIDFIEVRGLAKRMEEVWTPGVDDPAILPRRSEGLYLLQRIRDEAHRFAIAYHRQRRAARSKVSALDDITGLGPTRKKALLRKFGSVRKLRAATPAELTSVAGIGPGLAEVISAALATTSNSPAVNLTTGEIVGHADDRD